MPNRMKLQEIFRNIIGSNQVYYQAPESIKMQYPAIVYHRKDLHVNHANNRLYSCMTAYEVVLITENPDSEIINRIAELPYCSYDRHYAAENLNHEVFTLYF